MAECVRTPTATTSVASVTRTVFTTTHVTESSRPTSFVTSTFLTESCGFDPEISDSICVDVTSTTVRTIPGESTTITLTEITTLPVTTFVPTTLFGTSCPPDVTPTPDPEPPVTPPSDSPLPPTSSSSSSSFYSGLSTQSRSSATSSGSTLSSGSALPSVTSVAQSGGGTNVAPIVGGAVGGAVGLVALAMLAWFAFKKASFGKSAKFDNIFNKANDLEDAGHFHPEKLQAAQNLNSQPPNNGTNNAQQAQGQQPVYQDGAQTGYQQGDPTGGLEQTYNGGEYQPQGNESEGPELDDIKRKHLRRLFGNNDEQGQQVQQQVPHNQMPPPHTVSHTGAPPVAPFVVNQVYPPQQPQYSNPPVAGYQSHQAQVMQQGYYTPSNHSHMPSVASSNHYGPQYGMPQQPVGGPPPNSHVQGHTPSHSVSSYDRSGSPVSVQNAQVLQVMNPEPSYNQGPSGSSGNYSAVPAPMASYPTDGKGRPVNTMGEKAPIVHLDGGRYEESGSLAGTTHPPSGPPPPAYT